MAQVKQTPLNGGMIGAGVRIFEKTLDKGGLTGVILIGLAVMVYLFLDHEMENNEKLIESVTNANERIAHSQERSSESQKDMTETHKVIADSQQAMTVQLEQIADWSSNESALFQQKVSSDHAEALSDHEEQMEKLTIIEEAVTEETP